MDNYIQNWTEVYVELCELVSAQMGSIQWQDLWHNQVNFLEEEHPFPTPALFYAFRIINADDLGEKAQDVDLQVDIYHFFETFDDTYEGSYNQESALAFLNSITDVYKLLQGTSGTSYSEMRRIGFAPIDTGSAGNLYRQSFGCKLRDLSAIKQWEGVEPGEIDIERGDAPVAPKGGHYQID